MREPLFDPTGCGVAVAAYDDSHGRRTQHKCDQNEARLAEALVILWMGNRLQRAWKEDAERSDIKNAFHRPNCELRRKGEIRLSSNKVRANEFTRASQKSQPGESNQCGRYKFCSGAFGAHWFQEYLPSQGSDYVGGIDEQNTMKNVPFLDSMGLAPECSPVERPPVSILQIYKNSQYAQHHYAGKNALLIHEGEAPRRGPATRSGKRQFQGKRARHQGQTSADGRKVVEANLRGLRLGRCDVALLALR